jgi:uncharacterized protein YndB with AHSA1/START domain
MPPRTETILVERELTASPSQVFDAWSRVDLVRQWLRRPSDAFWEVHLWEARLGGRIHATVDAEGRPAEVRGAFLLVEPPGRLKYRWSDDEFVEVSFDPNDSGTTLLVAHTFPSAPDARSRRAKAWSHSLDLLGRIALAQP